MIYSKSDKVEQYLSHYNINSVISNKSTQSTKFNLKNIHTNLDYKLEIQNPLYNILSQNNTHFSFREDVLNDSSMLFKNLVFENSVSFEYFYNNYIDKDYYKRFGVIEHIKDLKQSSEHFSYIELKDIEKIKQLSGLVDDDIVEIFGNFFKLNDNSLRFIFNPTVPVLENINEIFFAHSYIFTMNGHQYPMYYIIYTTTTSNDVMFEQSNLLVNSITNKGTVTVNLSKLFQTEQPTIYNDMKTLNGFNTSQFIVNNLFTCAIFRNTINGIVRFIPINYNQNFFHIIFNKMNINISKNYHGSDFSNLLDSVSNDKISNILNEEKIVPQLDIENSNFLNQLISLSSTAEYFNDVLFSINDTAFQFPVYLVNEYNETVAANKPYGTQENVDIINLT